MEDLVVKPNDIYQVYFVNDDHYSECHIMSVDENWIELAVNNHGYFKIEIYPKAMIKKFTRCDTKKTYLIKETENRVSAYRKDLSSDEIVMSRALLNATIFESRDDAVEYVKSVKQEDKKNGRERESYQVQYEENYNFENV